MCERVEGDEESIDREGQETWKRDEMDRRFRAGSDGSGMGNLKFERLGVHREGCEGEDGDDTFQFAS